MNYSVYFQRLTWILAPPASSNLTDRLCDRRRRRHLIAADLQRFVGNPALGLLGPFEAVALLHRLPVGFELSRKLTLKPERRRQQQRIRKGNVRHGEAPGADKLLASHARSRL